MGAKHLHLQPQDFPRYRRPLQARRAVDRPEEENLLQVAFNSCSDVHVFLGSPPPLFSTERKRGSL